MLLELVGVRASIHELLILLGMLWVRLLESCKLFAECEILHCKSRHIWMIFVHFFEHIDFSFELMYTSLKRVGFITFRGPLSALTELGERSITELDNHLGRLQCLFKLCGLFAAQHLRFFGCFSGPLGIVSGFECRDEELLLTTIHRAGPNARSSCRQGCTVAALQHFLESLNFSLEDFDIPGRVLVDAGVVLNHLGPLGKLQSRKCLAKALCRRRNIGNHKRLCVAPK
mmetsp:Transcript_6613/g.19601  ORF Transcript_6613/g.19601 Transcript_6613/m.19601 type:complete len:229 (-) Transcript_6613:913-1599(-)